MLLNKEIKKIILWDMLAEPTRPELVFRVDIPLKNIQSYICGKSKPQVD